MAGTVFAEVLVFLATVVIVVWFARLLKRVIMEVVNLEGQSAFERGLESGMNLLQAYGDLCQRDCPYRSGIHAGSSTAPLDPLSSVQPPPPDSPIAEHPSGGSGGGGRPSVKDSDGMERNANL